MNANHSLRAFTALCLGLVVPIALGQSVPAAVSPVSSLASSTQAGPGAEKRQLAAARLNLVGKLAPQPLQFFPVVAPDGEARFIANGTGYSLTLGDASLMLTSRQPPPEPQAGQPKSAAGTGFGNTHQRLLTSSAEIEFVGANRNSKAEGLDPSGAYANFILGNDPAKWRSHVTGYSRVRYRNLYHGTDLIYYGRSNRQLEYDLVVSPGADPSQIRLRIPGDRPVEVDEAGNLLLDGKDGSIRLGRPMLYQDLEHGKRAIAGSFVRIAKNEFGFKTEKYDHTRPLVIDPDITLVYSTYIGGRQPDAANDIGVDAAGNSYIVGDSASQDFPISSNAYQPVHIGIDTYKATVTKFASSGAMLYSTFLGGSNNDYGNGIAIDAEGNAYITGSTNSTDFPTTGNAYSTSPGAGFVAEISPDGSVLEYSSYYGGAGQAMALNSQGQVVFAGTAAPGLATTTGSYKPTLASGNAAFVAIFDLTKTGAQQLAAATYYGTDTPMANDVLTGNSGIGFALDGGGNIWIGGGAYTPNLPTTANAYQASLPSMSSYCAGDGAALSSAAYLAELSSNLTQLKYATYFSGKTTGTNIDDCSEYVNHLVFDSEGNLYATGSTASATFPVTTGVFQGTNPSVQGGSESSFSGWVAKFAPNTPAPNWSSYFGGNGGDTFFSGTGHGSAIDSGGNLWIAGGTQGGSNFPISAGAIQASIAGSYNAFVSQIKSDGTQVLYSTYLGGSGSDFADALAIDTNNNLYVVGSTTSTDFPVTDNAFENQLGRGCPDTCTGSDMFFAILGGGTIGAVSPTTGGNTGDTTITISGAGLESGASCSLVQGATTISAISAVVNGDGTSITCTFALNGAATGAYSVVVGNPGGATFTALSPFTVESGGQPVLSVAILGWPVILVGQPSTYFVNVTNTGNETAYFTPLWITLPVGVTYSADQYSQQSIPPVVSNDGTTTYINYLLGAVTPGQTLTVPLQIISSAASVGIPLTAGVQPPWFSSSAALEAASSSTAVSYDCVSDPADSYTLDCLGPYLLSIAAGVRFFTPPSVGLPAHAQPAAARPADDSAGGSFSNTLASYDVGYLSGNYAKATGGFDITNKYPLGSIEAVLYDFGYLQGFYNSGHGLPHFFAPPPPPPPPPPEEEPVAIDEPIGGAYEDPNYKSGPSGDNSPSAYVRGTAALTYSVGFANEPTATLPVPQVVVTDQLDPTKVNLSTLSLGTITFGTNVITPPTGSTSYSTTYPLSPTLDVSIQGSLNSTTGLLKWTFTSIDPSTGLPPTDPAVGFLPPNTDGVVGQGSVQFMVMPKAGQTTGTQITNQATVVFGVNAPINTPTWLNTLDVNPPVSHVSALPATEPGGNFIVSWSGTDVGSGIVAYTIYVSVNGGAFTPWLSGVNATSTTYAGVAGDSYAFYSIATDGAGNMETAKTAAEATTTVAAGTATSTMLKDSVSGAAVTLTATVTPASGTVVPTGTVTFFYASTSLGAATLNGAGVATLMTTFLPVGNDSVNSQYSGDTNFEASSSNTVVVDMTLTGTTTTLGSSNTSTDLNASVTFTALVLANSGTALPTGSVAFLDGASVLGTGLLDSGGEATFSTTSLAAGMHSITAVYAGTSSFAGSTSAALTQTVNSTSLPVVPSALSLSPASATANSGTLTLTVNGTNFAPNSVVLWDGAVRATTIVNSTQLTATILAADIQVVGTHLVTVADAAPNAATSAAQPFLVQVASPVAMITGASLAIEPVNNGYEVLMTLNGTGFVPGSVVQWNGMTLQTDYESPWQISAVVPLSYFDATTPTVTVINPGGTSAGFELP